MDDRLEYIKFVRRLNKFPDTITDIDQLQKLYNIIDAQYKIESKFKINEYIVGGVFDLNAFNVQADKVENLARMKRHIKEKIRLLQLNYKFIDFTDLSIKEFIYSLYLDIYTFFIELGNIKKINDVITAINKNYRRLTFIFIILLIVVIYFIIRLIIR